MTTPVRKHRDYENDYPSVTTVLSELRKIGLEMWYQKNTWAFCQAEMKKGKEAGTDIHKAIEHYIETGVLKIDTNYPEEVTNALKSFVLFKTQYPQIQFKLSETKMTSEIYKVNGTMDIVAEIDGKPVVGDWKNSTAKDKDRPDVYPEYITQLSAYRELYAETSGVRCNGGFIVVFAKDKVAYNFREVTPQELNDHFTEVFLPALKIYNYQHKKKEK